MTADDIAEVRARTAPLSLLGQFPKSQLLYVRFGSEADKARQNPTLSAVTPIADKRDISPFIRSPRRILSGKDVGFDELVGETL